MPFAVAAAGVAAVGGIAGSVIQAGAAKDAASKQAQSQQAALDFQKQTAEQNRNELQPFVDQGSGNATDYANFWKTNQDQSNNAWDAAEAHIPGTMSQAELEATPGYQFNLSTGLRSVQNAAAAKGLGVSGAAMQGASKYATGLADATYQNQFNNKQALFGDYTGQAALKTNQLNTIYNELGGSVNTGENAAAQSGNQAQNAANNVTTGDTNIGNAQAAGITGSANAFANGIQSAANAPLSYLQMQRSNDLATKLGGGGSSPTITNGNPIQTSEFDGQTVDTSGWGGGV